MASGSSGNTGTKTFSFGPPKTRYFSAVNDGKLEAEFGKNTFPISAHKYVIISAAVRGDLWGGFGKHANS